MIHAWKIFTVQELEVLGGRTSQRACEDKSHSFNVRALQHLSISLSPCPWLPHSLRMFGARSLPDLLHCLRVHPCLWIRH